MMKRLSQIMILILISISSLLAQKIAVPYYNQGGTGQIKVYDLVANPATLLGTLSTTVSGINYHPNGIAFYNTDMFIAYDEPTADGFLHFKGVQVSSGTITFTSATKITTGTNTSEIVVDASGNLFVACGFGETNRGVKKYTRDGSGNYSFSSNLTMPAVLNSQWYSAIGGLAFDVSGNLYGSDLSDNRILKWTNATGSPTQFSCTNSSTLCQTQLLNTASQAVYPFSLPEGLVFDASGNLWVGNNNDGFGPNTNSTGGSLLKLNASYLASGGVFSQSNISIYSTTAAKFGGMAKVGSDFFVNDQGNSKVWKLNTSTGGLTDVGISAIYPGNGQIYEAPATLFPVSCTTPAPPTLTAEAITPSRFSAISSFNKLTASGCAGTVTWSTGSTASSINVNAAANPSSTYTATCKVGACVSTAASIVLNYITPPVISATPTTFCAGQNATFTATGCSGGTIKWYRQYSNTTFLIGGGTTTTYSYTDIGSGTTLSHAPNDYGLLFSHYSYYATCVMNGVNSGFSNAQTFTLTPVVNISPTVSNSGPITTGQPISLTAANLAPGGQVCDLSYGTYITVTQDIPSDNFTIEMWFKTSQSDVGLFSAGSTSITNLASDRHIYIDAWGILRFRAEPVTGASFSSNVVVNDNIWHHVAVTHSSTGTSSKIYVDGKLAASRTATYPCFAEQVFRIGISQETNTTYYSGQIENVRIWNVVKTFDEIRQTANLGTPATTTNLIYHAKLNGNANATIGTNGVETPTVLCFLGVCNTTYPTYPNVNYYTYTWTGQNAPIASINNTQTTTGAADGTYTLNVTPTIGCSVITATTAVISLSSTIPISPCYFWDYVYLRSGQSSTLTATGCTGTVSWTYHSIASTGNTIIVNYPNGRDDLTFVCTQSNGSVYTKELKISSDIPEDINLSIPINSTTVQGQLNPSFSVDNLLSWNITPPLHGVVGFGTSEEDAALHYYYTPNTGFQGVDTFKYSFGYNGECTGEGTFTITVGNPNPCPALLTLQSTADDIATGTVIKQASSTNGTIEATNAVTGTAKATYQAKSIQLNAGFKADNGTVFTAEIGGCASTGSTPTMQVNGHFLYDADNQKTILVGANLPILDDWDFPASDKLTELEKTGANAVRISWSMNYGQPARPAYSLTDLDNFLTKCKTNKMIPIVDIHDFTCGSDISVLNSQIIPWWTSAPVLAVINKHKKYLIINLANELGVYRWAGTPATALTTFKNAYKTAITSIRNAGIYVPIMIDAPDCGTTIGAFNTIGAELITHDPKHNLLLSAHAYWADYDGRPEIATSISNNLPIVFGELANKNDESILLVDGSGQPILDINGNQQYVTSYCHYDIDGTTANHPAPTGFTYQNLLTTCQTNEIGRMIWAWNKDNCSSRQMSSTGNYINLTTFGNDVVNNATYGIKTKAVKSNAF
jgi:mannan endo-1,4-beta-mannosidase